MILPIAVLVASFATLMSACSNAFIGPKTEAGGAEVYQGRIRLASHAPVEEDGEKDSGEKFSEKISGEKIKSHESSLKKFQEKFMLSGIISKIDA